MQVLEKLKILIVEDEPDIRGFVTDTLQSAAATVVQSSNADDALEALKTNTFDLIICDLRMPGMDGVTFMQRVIYEGFKLPVVVLSGYCSPEKMKQCRFLGAVDFLEKPFSSEQLVESISKIFASARRPRRVSSI